MTKINNTLHLVSSASLALGVAGAANAQILISPTGYTATPGNGIAQGGGYNYFDETGSQLTDGIKGANAWNADLGNGIAYEWVGWNRVDPTITFNFASPVTISQVTIGFNVNHGADIYLPTSINIGGNTFSPTGNEISDNTRGDLSLAGTWTGSSLTINLTRNLGDPAGYWIFTDEFSFQGAAVPEPAEYAAVAGLALVAFGAWRRTRR
jgi:hypothetical protein